MNLDIKVKKAQHLMLEWAEISVRPTRNGEQVRKYLLKANEEETIAGYAYVLKYRGFPHERNFHLLADKLTSDDIKLAHSNLEYAFLRYGND